MAMHTHTAEQLLRGSSVRLVEEMVLLTALSFADDPGTKYLFAGLSQAEYVARAPSYFRFLVKAALLAGASVTTISGDDEPPTEPQTNTSSAPHAEPQPQIQLPPTSRLRALGILIPPQGNATFVSPLTLLRAGILGSLYACGWSVTWRFLRVVAPAMAAMEVQAHPDTTARPWHWHLLVLATRPASQGKGMGTRILDELRRVAREAVPSAVGGERRAVAPLYLETASVASRRLYARVGFVEKASAVLGAVGEGEDVSVDAAGSVLGCRMVAMEWIPEVGE